MNRSPENANKTNKLKNNKSIFVHVMLFTLKNIMKKINDNIYDPIYLQYYFPNAESLNIYNPIHLQCHFSNAELLHMYDPIHLQPHFPKIEALNIYDLIYL